MSLFVSLTTYDKLTHGKELQVADVWDGKLTEGGCLVAQRERFK